MAKVFITPEERLRKIRERSYTERFDLLMRLIRINKMLRQAKIRHPKK